MIKKRKSILAHFPALSTRHQARVRVSVGIFAVAMLGMVAAFAVAPESLPEDLGFGASVQRLGVRDVVSGAQESPVFLHEDRIQKHDTLPSLFHRLGIDDIGAAEFIRSDPLARAVARQMRPGKSVSATTDASGQLLSLHFPLNGRQDGFLIVERRGRVFIAREESADPDREIALKSAEIRSSLFAATDAAGIPDAVATQLAEIFAGDIDFHRDLRKGDRFAVTYEVLRVRGQTVRPGRILAAEFINAGRELRAIYHGQGDGSGGYYDEGGQNRRKAFLRSPIEFSRVTSGFSNARFHPVLKEWRAHRGVDYGAPVGTRVRTTGDGWIESIGRLGGYGNLVIVRYAGGYSTAYGHLNAFAPGLSKGTRVRQGDVIGAVGQTGLASGPHLHYEFRVNNMQVNPLAIVMPEAPPLVGASLAAFGPSALVAVTQLELARSTRGIPLE